MQAKIIRKLNRLLKKVKSHKERMSRLSDEELSHLTVSFRERLKSTQGVVKKVEETPKGFFVTVEFDE